MTNILNPELVAARKNAVVAALKEGHSYTRALKIAGLNPRSAAQWRESDLAFEEAIQSHLRYEPRAIHNQNKPTTRIAKDIPAEEKPDVVEELCKAIRSGLPLDYCCLLTNVSRGTVRKWMTEDQEIAARVNKAQAQNLLWWISKIRAGAEHDWKAAVVYLERVFPALFAEVKAVEITTRTEEKMNNIIDVSPEHIVKKLTAMSDDELRAIVERGEV